MNASTAPDPLEPPGMNRGSRFGPPEPVPGGRLEPFLRFGLPLLLVVLVGATRWNYLAHELRLAGYAGFPLDDAWIHLTFGRNFSEGHGLSFNPGVPSSGSTAPLWSVLVGLLHRVSSGPPVGAVHLLGTVLALSTAWLTYKLGRRLFIDPYVGALAALLTALEWHLCWAALSGMEILLSASLMLLTVIFYLDERPGIPWRTALTCGLAVTTRPEACVLFGVLMIDYGLEHLRARRIPWVGWGVAGVVFGLTVAPEIAWNLHADGHIFPQTFYAKGNSIPLLKMPLFLGQYISVFTSLIPGQYLVMAFAAVGIATQLLAFRAWRGRNFLLAFLALFLLAYAHKRGDASYHGRYMQPLIPFFILYAARGLANVASLLAGRLGEEKAGMARATLALAACLGFLQANLSQADVLGRNVRDVNKHVVSMGKWLRENIPRDKKIAMSDIGALTYFSGSPMVDMRGLVSPFYGWDGPRELEHERQEGVDYVIVFPMFNQRIVRDGDYEPLQVNTVKERSVTATNDLVVYRTYIREPRPTPLAGAVGFNFDDGTYQGWQIEGEAFETPRANPDKVKSRGPLEVIDLNGGKYLASSWKRDQDKLEGRIVSPPFTLEGKSLKLRVGGGNQPQRLWVALLVDGKVVRKETGPESNVLITRTWDVSQFVGKQAQLEVVDHSSGPWGHILVDEVRQYP